MDVCLLGTCQKCTTCVNGLSILYDQPVIKSNYGHSNGMRLTTTVAINSVIDEAETSKNAE